MAYWRPAIDMSIGFGVDLSRENVLFAISMSLCLLTGYQCSVKSRPINLDHSSPTFTEHRA